MTLKEIQIKVLNKSKDIAINSLQNFFKINDLDPSLFNHLYEIDFKIDNCEGAAEYNPKEFSIAVDSEYLNNMVNKLMNCKDDKSKTNIYLNIAVTLVHELLHANRTIMIEKGINPKSIKSVVNNIEKKENDNVEEINYYKALLLQIIDKPYVDLFNCFIPIKIKDEGNGLLTVVAYNKDTNNFYIFENQKFNSILDGNIDEFIKNIGIELNNKELHKANKEIVDPINIEDDYADSYLASDYYHKHNDISTLDDVNDALDRIEGQSDFEEVISETLASIIIMTRNDRELDLEKINKKIQNGNSDIDEKLCMKIIYNEGPNMIKWFLTSVYDSEYYDKFEKIFNEVYTDLLMDFSDIYGSILNDEEVDSFSVDDAYSIINKKTGKSR